MQEYKPFKSGKVREMYDIGDSIVMVATDRISAFDVILKNDIKKKGTVLTQLSKFWFDFTKDIVPNHMLSVDVKDMPEFFQKEEFTGNSMKCQKLEMLPVECIVRGYITGSGWSSYKESGEICGIKLPEGLQECQKLPEVLFTPSTKAEIGDHDENISVERSIEVLEKLYPGRGKEYWIQDCSAASQNILLAVKALGLGAVWTGVYPGEDRVAVVRKILNIPEDYMPLNVIPIGVPAENPPPCQNNANP